MSHRCRVVSLSILILGAIALPLDTGAEPKNQGANYVALMGPLGIGCHGDHSIIPADPPTDLTDIDSWTSWVLSGEPECAHAVALNQAREASGEEPTFWAIGATWQEYDQDDAWTLAIASTDDAVFGVAGSPIRIAFRNQDREQISVEGCGTQMVELQEPEQPFWQPPEPAPALWWAHVRIALVEDDLTTCFGSTGTLHAQWGA
jgi:hypothetical protein